MGRLTNLGATYGTDKAEHHGFTEFYEDFFQKFSEPNILEVGILDGASLRTYDDYYYHKAYIVGIDINDKGHLNKPTIKILQGDIMTSNAIDACENAIKGKLYDIIIDDGGHYMEQQQVTLYNLWNLLKPGGIFIVEDLHTSGIPEYNPHNSVTTLELLNNLKTKSYKHSIYLTISQQKELNSQIEDIRIWSKPGTNQPSITCVITKSGNNNQGLIGKEQEEAVLIQDVINKQKAVYDNVEIPSSTQFKKSITVIEPKQDEDMDDTQAHIEEHKEGDLVVVHNESRNNENELSEIGDDLEKILDDVALAEKELLKLASRISRIKEFLESNKI